MSSCFRVSYHRCRPDEELKVFLENTIEADCQRFQVRHLIIVNPIQIDVLQRNEFEHAWKPRFQNNPGGDVPVAFVDDCVRVVHRSDALLSLSRDSYFRIIRHECVHVLQLLASQVRPISLEWLYESVACAVAEQQQEIREAVPSWETFSQCFYTIPNCYAIAYKFGVALLDHYTIPEMMRLSKSRDKCTSSCRQLYQKLFNR